LGNEVSLNKKLTIAMAIFAGLLAGAVPVVVSLHLAQQQSLRAEQQHMLGYARDVLLRSEATTRQAYLGIDRLVRARTQDPCSPAQIALMGEIDLVSANVQTMGYIEDGHLVCTALGMLSHSVPLDAGQRATGKEGVTLHTKVKLPFAPGVTFIVLERAGYAAVIHEDITLDIPTNPANVSLATYSPRARSIRSSRGLVRQEWVERPRPDGETTFTADGYLVALVESSHFSTVTMAAVPLSQLHERTVAAAKNLVPLGVAAGLALAFLVLLATRQQMAPPALIRAGLRRHEFFVLYQPIVNLQTRQCVGAEALVRWRRKDGSITPPDRFIPAAEESGLIQALTQRVFTLCARDLKDLLQRHPGFHLGINLSSADLQSAETVVHLRKLMRATGAGPQQLVMEATERGLMNAEQVRAVIHDIRALGMEVAVDDFGTGYSSLSYLGTFELDYLKIDKSFVDTLDTDAATSHVAMHIIDMAKSLNLKMIAEGVETAEQVTLLCERGVQFAQGWLFGKPMSMADLAKRLTQEALLAATAPPSAV
jgi:sensor c-di-GMP phosphodiesterase-like protein